MQLGEVLSTAQRSRPPAQQFIQRFLSFDPCFAAQYATLTFQSDFHSMDDLSYFGENNEN
jgi:hypothetical protein